jgi:hypothetical protein
MDWAALLLAFAVPADASGEAFAFQTEVKPMADATFWALVEGSAAKAADPKGQMLALRSALLPLSLREIEAFQTALDAKIAAANSWDLWGAGFVIHGGMSDDGFEYFRAWLVSRGRATYEAALADPDRLAELIPAGAEPLEFEGFATVASSAWVESNGYRSVAMPPVRRQASEPSGRPWREDAAELAKRYPRLWARFGQAPLG